MSHNFKPGDLALTLIDDAAVPAYSVVTIDSRVLKGQECMDFDCNPDVADADGWFVAYPSADDEFLYYDNELMPLRGDFAPEQQKSREVLA